MRIAIISHGLSDGGAERVASIVANHYAAQGHDVLYLAVLSPEREYQLERVNKRLNTSVETLFFAADPAYIFVDSAAVRELASHKVDLKMFLPECIADEVNERLNVK